MTVVSLKGSSDSNHFIFEINVGRTRIRHTTTPKLNFWIDSKSVEADDVQIQSRSMSDPSLSDIDFKNKWLGSELPLNLISNRLKANREIIST